MEIYRKHISYCFFGVRKLIHVQITGVNLAFSRQLLLGSLTFLLCIKQNSRILAIVSYI